MTLRMDFYRAQMNNKKNTTAANLAFECVYVGHEGYLIEKVGIMCGAHHCIEIDDVHVVLGHNTIHNDILYLPFFCVHFFSHDLLRFVVMVAMEGRQAGSQADIYLILAVMAKLMRKHRSRHFKKS